MSISARERRHAPHRYKAASLQMGVVDANR
jgi:hypothetical protein